MRKLVYIILNFLPILVMIGLIPLITNDYILAVADIALIIISLLIRTEAKDFLLLIFGFVVLTISEWIFVSTGVETFTRKSLFGVMPLWLPILWGYAFIAIKRGVIKLTN